MAECGEVRTGRRRPQLTPLQSVLRRALSPFVLLAVAIVVFGGGGCSSSSGAGNGGPCGPYAGRWWGLLQWGIDPSQPPGGAASCSPAQSGALQVQFTLECLGKGSDGSIALTPTQGMISDPAFGDCQVSDCPLAVGSQAVLPGSFESASGDPLQQEYLLVLLFPNGNGIQTSPGVINVWAGGETITEDPGFCDLQPGFTCAWGAPSLAVGGAPPTPWMVNGYQPLCNRHFALSKHGFSSLPPLGSDGGAIDEGGNAMGDGGDGGDAAVSCAQPSCNFQPNCDSGGGSSCDCGPVTCGDGHSYEMKCGCGNCACLKDGSPTKTFPQGVPGLTECNGTNLLIAFTKDCGFP